MYLSITSSDSIIHATIKDNGIGFVVSDVFSPQHTKTLGLIGMRERLSLIGGELEIVSSPGHGTTINARLTKE